MVTATRRRIRLPEPTVRETVYPILEEIRLKNNGILLAESVVIEAEHEDSPLHPYFEWDDTEAAQQYRIAQARRLIATMVVIIPNVKRPVMAYVSLMSDRQQEAGGYRAIVDVMSDPEMRASLLNEALETLRHWEHKYRQLELLLPIFEAARAVRRQVGSSDAKR